jgi:hypothetical protein
MMCISILKDSVCCVNSLLLIKLRFEFYQKIMLTNKWTEEKLIVPGEGSERQILSFLILCIIQPHLVCNNNQLS